MKKMLLHMLFLMLIVTGMESCSDNQSPRSLFQGKDSDQWTSRGNVTLDNQLLVLDDEGSITLKKGNFENFELNVTARTVDKGKGSIAFHTDQEGAKGYQVSINNDNESPVWWTKTGSLLAVRNLTKSIVKTNEWFDLQIRVNGKKITVFLNGFPVVEYTEPAQPYRTAHNAAQLLSAGTFVIRSSEGTIEIKSISVTPLNDNDEITKQLEAAIDETTDPVIRLHQENFPVLDYHVHLKGITADQAATRSRQLGINYALAPNCGIGFPITNDAEVLEYLDAMKGQPFIQAMQGEGREWPSTFSKEVRDRFDYVFTDAMTFTDTKGRRTRLWIPEEVFVEDEQAYMDLIVQKIVDVMQEPMDVYVNPTFLPEVMSDRYDSFWTEARMDKVIAAMVSTGKVLEINNRYKIPNQAFIQKAKDAGLKFTFGTNNADGDFGKLEYCIKMKELCGLTAADMYKPIIKD
ncbi:MAG: family 16 glycoside hydrolase [Proteiniphilum sp.]